MSYARSMEGNWKRADKDQCEDNEFVTSVKIGPVTWTIPRSYHVSNPSTPQGTLMLFHHARGMTPSIRRLSKSEESQSQLDCRQHVVLVRRLEDLPFQRAAGGGGGGVMIRTKTHPETRLSVTGGDTGAASVLKEGLGCVARVLALSVASKKRELLCDRKDPFVHLTPRRLALTVIKASLVVGGPMLNEVILESLEEEDERRDPSWSSNEGGVGQGNHGFSGFLLGEGRSNVSGRVFVDAQGNVARTGERDEEEQPDVMKSLARSFEHFPALAFRRILHNVMAVSTQRILEWQAVMHLSKRTADRLTKNIAMSALRKTKRMTRGKAAAKMVLTAGKALCFQNLALFIVDEVFVAVRLVFQERDRRKSNPYACTDWEALLRELREKTAGNALFVVCLWAAGTVSAMVGTMVYPNRGPDLLALLAEMGVSTLLS